jgi:hypothetical protein
VDQPTGHFEHVERPHTFPLPAPQHPIPTVHPRGELLPAFQERVYFNDSKMSSQDVLFSAKFEKQGMFNVVTISTNKII